MGGKWSNRSEYVWSTIRERMTRAPAAEPAAEGGWETAFRDL
nr:truncated nef protein [Human immunodeficiency virus 1]